MKNKLLISLILCMLLVTTVSAVNLNPFGDNKAYSRTGDKDVSNFIKENINDKYGVITLNSQILWIDSGKVAEYSLTKNTEYCILNCEAEGKAVLYKVGTLFDDTKFKDLNGLDASINNSKYYIYNGTVQVEKQVAKFKEVCGKEPSGRYTCGSVLDKYVTEKQIEESWIEYNGETLKKGNYRWKIKGVKDAYQSVDFIPVKSSNDFNEWATWTSSLNVGLTEYHNFDQGTGTVLRDDVYQKTNYTITTGTGSWNATGKLGGSYNFDGAATEMLNTSTPAVPNNSFTLVAWVMPYTLNSYMSPFGNFGGTSNLDLRMIDTGLTISFQTNTGGDLSSSSNLKQYKWNFIAITYNGTKNIFINGTRENSGAGQFDPGTSKKIGVGGNGHWSGQIDEIGIWNRTLSDLEIQDLYNNYVGLTYVSTTATLTATASYPSLNNITGLSTQTIGCNFSSTNQNISSVTVNVTNISTGTQVFYQATSISDGIASVNQSWTTSTLANGIYNWSCSGFGNQGINATSSIRNFTINSTTPAITIIKSYPFDGFASPSNTVNLGCNFTAIYQNISSILVNVTDSTGVQAFANKSNLDSTLASINQSWITSSLVDGTYNWSCSAIGSLSGNASTSNTTFYVDTLAPLILITYPQNSTFNTNVTQLNWSIIHPSGTLSSCWYALNSTGTNITTNCNGNLTDLSSYEGSNTWRVYANDTSNNVGNSSITFFKDTVIPLISFGLNTDNSTALLNRRYIKVNTTISDLSNMNLTIYIYNSSLSLINLTSYIAQPSGSFYQDYYVNSDGTYYFNASVMDLYGNVNITETRNVSIDTTLPAVTILYPTSIINYAIIGQNISLNYSVTDTNLQACWFNYNGTNLSTSCTNNNSILIGYAKSIIFYANDTHGNLNSTTYSWNYNVFEINQTYNTITTEGNIETFNLNVSTIMQISTANLIYNGTTYSGILTNYGSNNYIAHANITILSVTAQINKSFYWQITLADGTMANSTGHNQTVQNLNIDDCSSYPKLIMNLSLKDEDLRTLMNDSYSNSTIELQILIYPLNSNNTILEYNASFSSKNNVRLCMPDVLNNSNYYLNGIIRYTATGYVSEFYNLQNNLLNNATIPFNINLYDLLSSRSQEFLVTFKDSNFIPQSDVLVNVNRKYIPQGNFETVEVGKTDTAGQTLIHLVLSEVIYTLTMTRNGQVLAVLDSVLAKCDNPATGVCTIPINELATTIPLNLFKQAGGINYVQTFNETTKIITTTFVSTEGIKTVSINATKFDRFGNTTVCSDSLTSTSGTLVCTIPDSFGNSTVITQIYSNNEPVATTSYSLKIKASEVSGAEGIILGIIVVITLSMLFITSPIAVLFGAGLGLVFSASLFLFEGGSLIGKTAGILIYFVICCSIIVWKINKNGEQS